MMYLNYPELVHKHPTHLDVHFVNFCKCPQATETGNLVHMCNGCLLSRCALAACATVTSTSY